MAVTAAIAAAAGSGISALSSLQQGKAAKANADFQAAQLDQQAGQEAAVSQRAAEEERRKATILTSNLRATVGGDGGNLDDPTISKLGADIAGQGELNALTALYTGKERQASLQTQAEAARVSGRAANKAAKISAITSLISAAGNAASASAGAPSTATPSPSTSPSISSSYLKGTAPWKF